MITVGVTPFTDIDKRALAAFCQVASVNAYERELRARLSQKRNEGDGLTEDHRRELYRCCFRHRDDVFDADVLALAHSYWTGLRNRTAGAFRAGVEAEDGE